MAQASRLCLYIKTILVDKIDYQFCTSETLALLVKDYPTVAKFATVQNEGGRVVERMVEYYNLDMIISVGYRVKSQRGIQFRIWANNILKDYLLKGYSLNNRMNPIEDNVQNLLHKVNEIDLQINTHNIPTQGVFLMDF